MINVKEILDNKELFASDYITVFQQLQNVTVAEGEEDLLLDYIKNHIEKEVKGHYNQVTLNAAFRLYYNLLEKYHRPDLNFIPYLRDPNISVDEKYIVVQYFVLLTAKTEFVDPLTLRDKCLMILSQAVDENEAYLLTILKTINMIFKKWPNLDVGNELSLEQIYFCLQSNQMGMRDEMLLLLKQKCLCREAAFTYFSHILHFWPWTNRSKLYVIGCILKRYKLNELLEASEVDRKEFFNGLRIALNFKNLLAPSQSVIQALSSQSSKDLLDECRDILINGTLQELRNFNAHWFSRLQTTEELFESIQNSSPFEAISNNEKLRYMSAEQSYRVVNLFSLFSKEVLQLNREIFFNFCRNIAKECYELELQTQLLIFKIMVANLANLVLENAMDFLIHFIQKHMQVENAQFRNTILGKIPTIINHLSKTYSRCCSKGYSQPEQEANILNFFELLHKYAEDGIQSAAYQPKIFALKLLEMLIKSLYGKTIQKNAKNCNMTQNQQLGQILRKHKIFDAPRLCSMLIDSLKDPSGFDDALDLTVTLIGLIQADDLVVQDALENSSRCCALSDVDEANLSCFYARVFVENCMDHAKVNSFFKRNFEDINSKVPEFVKDPLWACKTKGNHLFSSLNVINQLFLHSAQYCLETFEDILATIENITTALLKMMNKCNSRNSCDVSAASFEDMDKSLQILVSTSNYTSEDDEGSRKYLLMTFWLSLKACCDLSASMGDILVRSGAKSDHRLVLLERCLQISVIVLTKCRHKGAIETAGNTIGKLTKCISSSYAAHSEEYNLLHKCVRNLCNPVNSEVSTTRRGAGFAIMFLHIIKNEDNRGRPLLNEAIKDLLKSSADPIISETRFSKVNCDLIEALHLHYLCVLVRDTELKEAVSRYYNEIMMAAILQIDNPEWTICNAALQLFGALVPKVVGQRQATEFCDFLPWEPSEVTFCEITRKLKFPFNHILMYCLSGKCSTRSVILFLEFLHKVEYIHKSSQPECLNEFREIIWHLLHHHCEKVRILAAKCFVRSHEFSLELPMALRNIAHILFSVQNENFFEGLVLTLQEGILKLQHDSKFVISLEVQQVHIEQIKCILIEKFSLGRQYKFYSLCKLWDLLVMLGFDKNDSDLMYKLKDITVPKNDNTIIALDLWQERIHRG